MSNVRVDISPAKSTRKRDISSWVEPDISRLSARGNRRYNKRKNAVQDYFTTDLPLGEITLQHHLSSEILMRLVEQSCMQHEDGTLWGYRALVPGVIVIDHAPVSDSKEDLLSQKQDDMPTKGSPEEVIGGMPCTSEQASFDEGMDVPIEDDEDTQQRPAVKIASATVPLAPLATVASNGHDIHQTDSVEVRGEDTVVATEETNDPENAVEIEDPQSIDNGIVLETAQVEEEVEKSTTERVDSEIDSGAEEEAVVVKDDVEQEERVIDGDHPAGEEVVDSSQSELVEPEDAVGEEEIEEEGRDLQEEKLDASSEEHTITDFSDAPEDAISSTEIVVRESLIPAVLPLYGKSRKRINIKKVATDSAFDTQAVDS